MNIGFKFQCSWTIMNYEAHEEENYSILSNLPANYRSAFAAACAGRVLPAFTIFHKKTGLGNEVIVAGALEYVWKALAANSFIDSECKNLVQSVEENIPPEDENWTKLSPYADDAAASIAYTLDSLLSSKVEDAIYAARRVCEAIEYFIEFHSNPVESGQLLTAEFHRQSRDLHRLSNCRSADFLDLLVTLKSDSAKEFALPNLSAVSI
jgi:uncharacterized protein YjaG (DUF416 family)